MSTSHLPVSLACRSRSQETLSLLSLSFFFAFYVETLSLSLFFLFESRSDKDLGESLRDLERGDLLDNCQSWPVTKLSASRWENEF
jgi:hypothetical protein